MSQEEIKLMLKQDKVEQAIDSLATTWSLSDMGVFSEVELMKELTLDGCILQEELGVEIAFTVETKNMGRGPSIVRMFNSGDNKSVRILPCDVAENSVTSSFHTHPENIADPYYGHSAQDGRSAKGRTDLNWNSYVGIGGELYVSPYKVLRSDFDATKTKMYPYGTFYAPMVTEDEAWKSTHTSKRILLK